jgi:hypothetical protein
VTAGEPGFWIWSVNITYKGLRTHVNKIAIFILAPVSILEQNGFLKHIFNASFLQEGTLPLAGWRPFKLCNYSPH